MTPEEIRQRLRAMRDPAYREFHAKLIPNIDPDTILGVRTPDVRKFAKELAKEEDVTDFLKQLPHLYYDENILHGCILSLYKDYEQAVDGVEAFLPYIDNWAVCDLLSPKVFRKNLPDLLERIKGWIASEHPYTVRFAVGMLMSFYLDEAFGLSYPAMVAEVKSEEYYVRMMVAWFFATALAKQPEAAWPWVAEPRLSPWVRAKAIQKALESRRITPEQKQALRALRDSL